MNIINGLLVAIPAPAVDSERVPLPAPQNQEALQLWNQLPIELREEGFGYFMLQVENENDLPENQLYWSYLANYYYYNHNKETFSFYDWQDRVQKKVGGYREPHLSEAAVEEIILDVEEGDISYFEGARYLFARVQLFYYGW